MLFFLQLATEYFHGEPFGEIKLKPIKIVTKFSSVSVIVVVVVFLNAHNDNNGTQKKTISPSWEGTKKKSENQKKESPRENNTQTNQKKTHHRKSSMFACLSPGTYEWLTM